tara:strand:+ start:138 stop:782 length:645 start_codon:yes stop_codon:yes gene_type:complete
MTAKIKLNAASGGGSVSIQAPSSSSNNRVISLPDIADGTLVTSESTLDATKLSGNLPALNGSSLTNLSNVGKILQVVTDTRTSSLSLTSDNTYNTISGLSQSITPAATSSKVLVLVTLTIHTSTSMKIAIRLRRGSTTIGSSSVGGSSLVGIVGSGHNGTRGVPINFHFLDSPNTTSSTSYTLSEIHNTGTFVLNDAGSNYEGSSMITLIEVGA